jgi:hypothetical protein
MAGKREHLRVGDPSGEVLTKRERDGAVMPAVEHQGGYLGQGRQDRARAFESLADPGWSRLTGDDEVAVGDRRLSLVRLARLALWGNPLV